MRQLHRALFLRARITSIRICRRAIRSASLSCRSSSMANCSSRRCGRSMKSASALRVRISKKMPASRFTKVFEQSSGHRSESRRHAAAGNCLRTRYALGERSRRVHAQNPLRSCVISEYPTATCRKARSAATPTCRFDRAARKNSARAPS